MEKKYGRTIVEDFDGGNDLEPVDELDGRSKFLFKSGSTHMQPISHKIINNCHSKVLFQKHRLLTAKKAK